MAIYRAIVKGSLFDMVEMRNMFICDVVPSGGDTVELLWTTYLDSIWVELEGLLSASASFYSYELYTPVGTQWELTDEVPFVKEGTSAGEALANLVAFVLIGKATGIRHMGRKFFSGISEAQVNGNGLAAGAVARAAATLAAYLTPFTGIGGGTITPGIYTAAGVFHPFVGGTVSSLLGTMRRRKPGLGV